MSRYPEYPTIDPTSPLIDCPYAFFKESQDEAPVRRSEHDDEFLVFRHAEIVHVLRNQELFSEEMPGGTPMDMDGHTMIAHTLPPEHKEMRAYASRPLTPKRLRVMEPQIERIVDELIDSFVSAGEVELMNEFALPLPAKLMCELMGLPTVGEEWELILAQWGESVSAGRGREYWPILLAYFAGKVDDRRVTPGDDMISELIQTQVERDGRFDRGYVTVVATELMVGGAGTTALMIVNAMWLLLQHPDQLAKVRADHGLIPAMLEEGLRTESVIQYRERIATADTTLGGVDIPAGARVRLVLGAGSRDPRAFDNPETFDVTRERTQLTKHLGYGYGAHFCLGAPLARAEGKIAFERLFTRLGDIRISPAHRSVQVPSTRWRSLQELRLEFDPAG
jgi:cytochrome P450